MTVRRSVHAAQPQGVSFVERDLGREMSAVQELAQKAAAAQVIIRGVPVIDVRGKLLQGFDPKQLDQAL